MERIMDSNDDLPDWAKEMSDANWEKFKNKYPGSAYTNCATCGKRLILALCKYNEPKRYCIKHCPEHKWQADYDWPTECGRCGILYTNYLESVLEKHGIKFEQKWTEEAVEDE